MPNAIDIFSDRIRILQGLTKEYPERNELERLVTHLAKTIKSRNLKNPTDKGLKEAHYEWQQRVAAAWQLYKSSGGKGDSLASFYLNNKELF